MSIALNKYAYDILVIGGSAGSFPVVSKILEKMPSGYRLPIVMCLHRLKDKREGFKEALEIKSALPIEEPNDKDPILTGYVYIAPANYHLLVEIDKRFSLATTELVQYSRPSIDVLFESVADIYRHRALAILLSGANRDGALGMKRIKDHDGYTVVQNPQESGMSTMPQSAIESTQIDSILSVDEIILLMQSLH
jgi:two-component system chemotaxis response regulator CheB